ncbi:Putative Beta-hexosaminidase [Rhizopus microsporus]|nr:Putative Beta-hexosaminidase [Rhizopus microsporus]
MKLSIAAAAALLLSTVIDAKTLLFPIPQDVSWTGAQKSLSSNFKITGADNTYVQDASKRYTKLIHKESWVPVQVTPKEHLKQGDTLQSLKIVVKDNKAKLDLGVDESYTLDVPAKGSQATLEAKTWVGALRGLETFAQLVQQGSSKGHLVAHTAHIKDAPSYPHRGVMLDTARNFYPVKDILRTIDAMAYNKMNVLHWHITDSQSWPIYIKKHPELSKKGAYTPDMVYSPKDVETIIKYGQSRGVRILPEIDMPAHTDSIALSHPELMACHGLWWGTYAAEPPAGQLNVIHPGTIKLVKDVIKEITSRFPDTLYHAGGDELNAKCWPTNKEMSDYVKKHKTTFEQVWYDFTNDIIDYVIKQKKRSIIWEDPVKDGGKIKTDTIIQSWVNPPSNYTSAGYDVIVSNYDYFYLDCGHGGWVGNDTRYISPAQTQTADDSFNYGGVGGSWCAPFKTWQRIYSYDMTHGVKESHKGKVLGGEVALWSEQSGPTVVDSRLWPRSSAAAEIYWSGSYDKKGNRRTLGEVQPRFNDWVLRMIGRGIGAEPNTPRWCLLNPNRCNLNEPSSS